MKQYYDRVPSKRLRVVIRNDAPLIHCQDHPAYRSVEIELTADQIKLLALKCVGVTGGTPIYEDISQCFLEPDANDNP